MPESVSIPGDDVVQFLDESLRELNEFFRLTEFPAVLEEPLLHRVDERLEAWDD